MTQKEKSYASAEIKPLAKSQIEITGSVAAEVWEKARGQALKNLNESLTIDGFRKGNIPENILISKVGDMAVLEEMAEIALPKAYVDILIDNEIDAIGKPAIHVTKLAEGNPLEFKAVTAVVPKLTLPDYKKIAHEQIKKGSKGKIEVSEKEIDDAVLRIRKMNASHEGHDHEKLSPEEHEKAIMESLPELNDEFVKKIGDFKDVADFRTKLASMIHEDKAAQAKEKVRIAIADVIADKTETELPDIMIQSELSRTEAQFRSDIEKMGVKLEDYLKHAKKTIEDIRKEWAPHAEKKAKLQLILNEIAKAESLRPSDSEVLKEVNHIMSHYKEADRERATVYAETVLTNEKVFKFLESQSN